jgi:hypothetical protein
VTADATRLLAAIERYGHNTQQAAAHNTAGLARFTGDIPVDSGELRGSIRVEPVQSLGGGRYRFRMVAPVIQAATTDKGARPHPIRPRRAGGLLVFNWPKAGGVVHLRGVNHPGNRAQNWWRPLLERSYRQGLLLAGRQTPFR